MPARSACASAGQDTLEHARDLRHRQPPDRRAQRAPLDVLHRDVRDAVLLEVIVDGHDVRMIERARDAGLAHEPLRRPLAPAGSAEFLERDVSVQVQLPREIDDRHAAAAELLEDLVATDPSAGRGSFSHRSNHFTCRESGGVDVFRTGSCDEAVGRT